MDCRCAILWKSATTGKEHMMELIYSCPNCAAVLNPDQNIILLGRHKKYEFLFAFHPEPGNYALSVPHNAVLNEGDLWEFTCPLCRVSLSVKENANLACLDMTDGVGNLHKVVFSRVAGEHATCVIHWNPEFEVQQYGANIAKYENCLWEKYI
jgi:hypothetical protein